MKNTLWIIFIITLLSIPNINFAQAPDLRSVADFVLFTKTGAVGNTGTSTVMGKIGTNTGAITGFTYQAGQQEINNPVTVQASADLQIIYDSMYAASQTFPSHAAILGNGETLSPGVHLIPEAASIEGTLILDAQGNPNAIFIIKIQGAFSPGPSSKISLIGGALACNVFWTVEGGAVAIAALSEMKGTFIANPGAVSMAAASKLEGRLLSTTGAVAVDEVIAGLPVCQILPVTLINFKATKSNTVIELSWTVDNERSFTGYDVERSADGNNYYKIGSIIPTNTAFNKTYTFQDNSPLTELNFYRLKMIDINNAFKYSTVLNIRMKIKKEITIYPNPTLDHTLLLQMYGQIEGAYILSIYNLNGKKVMTRKIIQGPNDVVRSIS
ncbi:MAG TPA: ice-binding family protein, partial [Segetibacter sp.]|nr:ice-binding family protein [Segetibacter sp.]